MSERGVFALDRGWFAHPVFAAEPFTEREAWAWLIAEAAFKDRTRRIGKFVIELARGQLAASIRFLENTWRWKPGKAQRFLKKLKTAAMIATDALHGITIITICNYNKYQRVSLPQDTQTATPNATSPLQQRYNTEDIKNTKEDDDGDTRATLISPEANLLADEIATITGHDLKFLPPSWLGAAWRVQTWLNEGWIPLIILASIREQLAKKRDGPPSRVQYYEPGIARAHAVQSTPLPKVEFIEGKKETVHVGKNPRSALTAIREIRSDIGGRGLGGGEDRGVVVSLSKR